MISKSFVRSECNKECGGGEQYRTRDEMSGTPDGLACTGDHTESRACNTVGCRTS